MIRWVFIFEYGIRSHKNLGNSFRQNGALKAVCFEQELFHNNGYEEIHAHLEMVR